MAKAKKKAATVRPSKYNTDKLAINGSFSDVFKVVKKNKEDKAKK